MSVDVFHTVADPRRREILDHLRGGPISVNQLVDRMGLTQPAVSKHLRVLRDSGLVTSTTAAQQRIYSLNHAPLQELESWLKPYRQLWERSFDALGSHLDRMHPPAKE